MGEKKDDNVHGEEEVEQIVEPEETAAEVPIVDPEVTDETDGSGPPETIQQVADKGELIKDDALKEQPDGTIETQAEGSKSNNPALKPKEYKPAPAPTEQSGGSSTTATLASTTPSKKAPEQQQQQQVQEQDDKEESDEESEEESDEESEEESEEESDEESGGSSTTPSKKASKKQKKRRVQEQDDDEESEEESGGSSTTATLASTTPSKKASKKHKKRRVQEQDDDEESDEEFVGSSKKAPKKKKPDDDDAQQQNLSDEQIVERLFDLNQPQAQPQGAQQGNGQPQQAPQGNGQQPQGFQESTLYAGPKKRTRTKVAEGFDFTNYLLGYVTDLAGGTSGLANVIKDDPQSDDHKLGLNIFNTGLAAVKAVSSTYTMSRQAHHAKKLRGRNRIEYKKNTVNAISSGIKTLGSLFSAGGGGATLGGDDYKDTASGLGIMGSILGITGSILDVSAAGYGVKKYKDIIDKYDPNKPQNAQNYADNAVRDAAAMASLHARHKQKQNALSAGVSAANFLGGLSGLGTSISSAAGSRLTSGCFGIIGNSIGLLSKISGLIGEKAVGGSVEKSSREQRHKYVNDYLDSEADEIVRKAQLGKPKKGIPGVKNITLEDGKRIALKKLGMFDGATVLGTPCNLKEEQLDMVYNALAMKRAQALHSSQNKGQMLADLGLNSNNATVEEIAAMLGYQK